MAVTEASVAMAILQQPLKDIYALGKNKFSGALDRWGNNRNIRNLYSRVAAFEKVKTIWQRDKEVKLSEFYFPSRLTFPTNSTKPIKSLKDIPTTISYVIEGTVGQGKSIFLRHLCVQELKKDSSGRIPIFIELRKLEAKFTLKEAVFTALAALGFEINDDLFDLYASSGKLILLLDAFDELEDGMIKGTLNHIEYWCERYSTMQVLVTSRPAAEIQKSRHFQVARLAPIGKEDHKPFLSKIGVRGESLIALMSAIDQSSNEVSSLLSTPLLLTLLVILYQSEQRIPKELPEFFEALFLTVFSRHDRTKPGFVRMHRSGLNERRLEQFFEAFCFAILQQGLTTSLSESQFGSTFCSALKLSRVECEEPGFRYDIIKVACLMQEDGLHVAFVHKSLLDYYAAAFVKHCTEPQAMQFYGAVLGASERLYSWRATLQFLYQIDKYRYSRYFGIPGIKNTLRLLGCDGEKLAKTDIESAFKYLFGEAIVSFSTNKEKSIRHFTQLKSEFFSDQLLMIGLNALLSKLDKVDLKDLDPAPQATQADYSSEDLSNDTTVGYFFPELIAKCDYLGMLDNLQQGIEKIRSLLATLEADVRKEDEKLGALLDPFLQK